MRAILLLGAALLALAGPARALSVSDPPAPPRIAVPLLAAPLPDEPAGRAAAWEQAPPFGLADYWKQTRYPLEPTEVRVLADPRALHVRFLAQDRETWANRTWRDDDTYLDDCVEVFLAAPVAAPEKSLGFEMNALGTLTDFAFRMPEATDLAWNAAARVTAARTTRLEALTAGGTVAGTGYVVELTVPWTDLLPALGLAARPAGLRANFGRWDYGSGGSLFTIWSDSRLPKPKPHQLLRYGWLDFVPVPPR